MKITPPSDKNSMIGFGLVVGMIVGALTALSLVGSGVGLAPVGNKVLQSEPASSTLGEASEPLTVIPLGDLVSAATTTTSTTLSASQNEPAAQQPTATTAVALSAGQNEAATVIAQEPATTVPAATTTVTEAATIAPATTSALATTPAKGTQPPAKAPSTSTP